MPDSAPFNPLDLRALAQNIEFALPLREPTELPPPGQFDGAGIYAIYYQGNFSLYKPISSPECKVPIYVGRALPKGARQGKVGIGEPRQVLADFRGVGTGSFVTESGWGVG
jgi:Eco29kI restriction endonuclease